MLSFKSCIHCLSILSIEHKGRRAAEVNGSHSNCDGVTSENNSQAKWSAISVPLCASVCACCALSMRNITYTPRMTLKCERCWGAGLLRPATPSSSGRLIVWLCARKHFAARSFIYFHIFIMRQRPTHSFASLSSRLPNSSKAARNKLNN